MLYLVSQTCRSTCGLAGNLLTSRCALSPWFEKNLLLSRAQGVYQCTCFCQCGLDLYSFSALGTASSTENWSGEAGNGPKGMPFVTAFRTLDDVAVLNTTDWAYIRPTSFCFLLLFGFFLNYHYWKKFRQKAMPLYIIFCVCDDSYILPSEQSLNDHGENHPAPYSARL